MSEQQLRTQLLDYSLQLSSSGLSIGKSGNISIRFDEKVLITPSGIDYQQLNAAHMVLIDLNGQKINNQEPEPSSEWHFHCDIYQSRPDINAIVHAHPTYCTALACTKRNIPAFHYMVAVAGGDDIPIADYALYGSQQLSDNIIKILLNRQACLLANHGMIAIGQQIESAFNLAIEVENLAAQYCQALKLGNINLLSDNEMNAVLAKFKHYGQRV